MFNDGIYRFQVGEIACTTLNDGENLISDIAQVKQIFPAAPVPELEHLYLNVFTDAQRRFSYNPLLLETAGQRVLIDTGNGGERGLLITRMQAAEIDPASIDLIFITHAHPDHIGGILDANGQPNFPQARYAMGETEWHFWMSADNGLPADFLEATCKKLRAIEPQLTFIQPGDQIAPGITALEAYGHTPGHLAVLVESRGERLLHIVDIAHSIVQVMHPDWSPRFDAQPDISPVTRRRILQRIADEKLLMCAYHFPFPPVGHIEPGEAGLTYRAVSHAL